MIFLRLAAQGSQQSADLDSMKITAQLGRFEGIKMIKGQIYKIPHTCYLYEWSTPDDGGYDLYGAYYDDLAKRYDKVIEAGGYRWIELVERVRDHWVVDTWIECSEGETRKKVSIRTHKYLKQLLRGAKLWGEA